ncbi:uncharacterized protein [Dipodomys merriami]|uniref:uncharacterized protein n=1 Tax=Dipodomys merriami TaxID=94247 RepID=UPI00384CDFAB
MLSFDWTRKGAWLHGRAHSLTPPWNNRARVRPARPRGGGGRAGWGEGVGGRAPGPGPPRREVRGCRASLSRLRRGGRLALGESGRWTLLEINPTVKSSSSLVSGSGLARRRASRAGLLPLVSCGRSRLHSARDPDGPACRPSGDPGLGLALAAADKSRDWKDHPPTGAPRCGLGAASGRPRRAPALLPHPPPAPGLGPETLAAGQPTLKTVSFNRPDRHGAGSAVSPLRGRSSFTKAAGPEGLRGHRGPLRASGEENYSRELLSRESGHCSPRNGEDPSGNCISLESVLTLPTPHPHLQIWLKLASRMRGAVPPAVPPPTPLQAN